MKDRFIAKVLHVHTTIGDLSSHASVPAILSEMTWSSMTNESNEM